METISLIDGLSLTVVSMVAVFAVLTSLWGLTNVVSYILRSSENEVSDHQKSSAIPVNSIDTGSLVPNKKKQQVAEMMALILASEDENNKFEIVESQRIK